MASASRSDRWTVARTTLNVGVKNAMANAVSARLFGEKVRLAVERSADRSLVHGRCHDAREIPCERSSLAAFKISERPLCRLSLNISPDGTLVRTSSNVMKNRTLIVRCVWDS